ncbi:MAG: hypothetical protein HND49_07365 [Planctomycetes bacterium]|nr:hypothetical protein [Planctomycetota bacterium]
MKKPKLIISFIFLGLILLVISGVSIVVVLVNTGKLTALIEQQVRKTTNMDINIGNVHVDPFSGLTLSHISIRDKEPRESFTLMGKSCTVTYNLLEVLTGNIAKISLSDIDIFVDTDVIQQVESATLPDKKTASFNIGDRIPHYVHVGDISIDNAKIQLKSTGNTITVTEIDLHMSDFHSTGNPGFSFSGRVTLSTSQSDHSPIPGDVKMNGTYDLVEDTLTLADTSHILLNQNTLFEIVGNIHSLTDTPTVNLKIDARNINIDTIPSMLTPFGLDMSSLPTVKGECNTRFSLQGNRDALTIQSHISIKDLSLGNENLIFKTKGLEIPFVVHTSPSGAKNKLTIEGRCMITEGELLIDNEQMMTIDLPIIFSLKYPHTLAVSSPSMKGNFFVDNTPIPISELISDLQMNLNLDQPNSIKFETSIQTTFSDPLFLSGTFDKEAEVVRDFTMKLDDIDCNAISRTMEKLIPEHLRELDLKGCLSLDATLNSLSINKRENTFMSSNISLNGVGFTSPDYEYFGENMNGNIETDITLDALTNRFSFHTTCLVEPFLVQLGTFTTDMRKRQTLLSLSGAYTSLDKNLSNISGTLAWDDIGAITIAGEVLQLPHEPHIDLELTMEGLSHTPLFDTFVKDTIQYSHPSLFQSNIEGELNGQFRFFGSQNALDVDGEIKISKTSLTHKDISIEDLNLNIPISLTYPTSTNNIQKQDIPDSQYGTMSIRELRQGPLRLEGLRLRPIIISNNFYIQSPLRIPVFGGTIAINDVAIENIITPDREVKLALQLQDINLEKITNTYRLTPLEGTLNSSLIPLEQKNDRLHSQGEMNIAVFGGDITISDLTLSNFLTPLMGIEFSAKISDLSLGKMSATYKDWGGITGVVNGDIEDFKLVAGEPSSFDIQVKTKKVDNIKQTVSTKFLKKFVPGIGTVLEKFGLTNYRYAVMGLHAILENDYITLQGAVREEGKDLFMKGAGFKKLEIVFYDANKKIQFKKFMNSFQGIMSSDFEETQVQIK